MQLVRELLLQVWINDRSWILLLGCLNRIKSELIGILIITKTPKIQIVNLLVVN